MEACGQHSAHCVTRITLLARGTQRAAEGCSGRPALDAVDFDSRVGAHALDGLDERHRTLVARHELHNVPLIVLARVLRAAPLVMAGGLVSGVEV